METELTKEEQLEIGYRELEKFEKESAEHGAFAEAEYQRIEIKQLRGLELTDDEQVFLKLVMQRQESEMRAKLEAMGINTND